MAFDIDVMAQNVIDTVIGRLAGSEQSFLMVNAVPMLGVISFTEPAVSIEHETLLSNLSKYPQAIYEKSISIGEGSIVMLESTLLKLKAVPFVPDESGIPRKLSPVGYMLGMPLTICKFVYGHPVRSDLRQLKVYQNVIPISQAFPELNQDLALFTVEVNLRFTKQPTVLELPI